MAQRSATRLVYGIKPGADANLSRLNRQADAVAGGYGSGDGRTLLGSWAGSNPPLGPKASRAESGH